jgi:predicted transcriptional regulator
VGVVVSEKGMFRQQLATCAHGLSMSDMAMLQQLVKK